jgi:hypothetical protein
MMAPWPMLTPSTTLAPMPTNTSAPIVELPPTLAPGLTIE